MTVPAITDLKMSWSVLTAIFLYLWLNEGGPVGAEPTRGSVMIDTKYGTMLGTRRTLNLGISGAVCDLGGILAGITDTVDEFLGVPYATPPVGPLRFQPPVPAEQWPSRRDATRYGSACPQDAGFVVSKDQVQAEDCLYLNIYTPYEEENTSRLYPVMVFIHGGSYLYGSGNRYNGTALAQFGVVLVAINYRLGALGFLTTGDDTLPGNYGLLDQIEALRWVNENAASFRGDNTKVTIFGSSAGGASVGLLMFSQFTKGLFHRVIAQSGTANAMWASQTKSKQTLRADVTTLAKGFGCYGNSDSDLVDCLRKADSSKFKAKAICKILRCNEVDPLFKPVVDGTLLERTVDSSLHRGDYPPLDYMTGTVRAEFGEHYSDGYTPEDLAKEVDAFLRTRFDRVPYMLKVIQYEYTNWSLPHQSYLISNKTTTPPYYLEYNRAEVLSDIGLVAPTDEMAGKLSTIPGMRVYLYHLDNVVSYHSVELNYVFGTPLIGGQVDEMGVLTNFTHTDREYCRIFMKLWTDFAKTGTPTPDKSVLGTLWQSVTPDNMDYMYIANLNAEMRTHLRAQKVALWNTLIPTILEDTPIPKHDDLFGWVFLGFSVALLLVVILLLCLIIHGNKKGRKYSQLLTGTSGTSYSVNL